MKKLLVLSCGFLLLFGGTSAQGQTDCSTQINTVLASLSGVCNGLEAGQVCFAHQHVTLAMQSLDVPVQFLQPNDRANFAELHSLQTSGFDPLTGAWGIALIRPSDTPSVLLMTGDVQLENRTAGNLLDLVVLTSTAAEPQCSEAQPGLTVYVPEGSRLELAINGASMSLEQALITIRQQTPNSLTLAVYQGQVSIIDGPAASAGQTLVAVTDNSGTIAFWSLPRAQNEHEVQQAQVVSRALDAMLQSGLLTSNNCTHSTTHTVQPGEWIYSIARQYNVSPQAIIEANALQDPSLLYSGQQLIIPCSNSAPPAPVPEEQVTICENSPRHRVSQGETLFGIAQRYGVPMQDIISANHLASASLIYEGQVLVIPCGVDSGSSAVAPTQQPGDDLALTPTPDSSPPDDFCQQDLSSVPSELQHFISTLCNQ
jgi:LysM repeat protein